MLPRSIESLTAADIQSLVDGQEQEGARLDYKDRPYDLKSDESKAELLRHVSRLCEQH
ncbi:MAG: hypothetical protein AAF627_20965 [Myxococcota bacterium]